MTTFWKIVKKYPCLAKVTLFLFLLMTIRVQGDIATPFEQTLLSFISGAIIVTCILYTFLYLTGSLNPGDKPIVDFKKIGEKFLKGSSEDQNH